MRVPEREKNEKRAECLFKGAEKFPNLDKDVDIQLMELIRHPTIFNAKRPSSRHIIIKQMKNQK